MSETIKTSEPGWLARLAASYKDRVPVTIIDDAHTGIDPLHQTLFDMGRSASLTAREIVGVCVACGMGLAGAVMVVAAILDPDPTSKLGILIASGAFLAFTGGFAAIRILTRDKPPNVKGGRDGFEVDWG